MIHFHRKAQRLVLVLAMLGLMGNTSKAAIMSTMDIVNNQSKTYALNFPQVGALYVHSPIAGWRQGTAQLTSFANTLTTAAHVLDGDDGMGGGITEIRFYLGDYVYEFDQFSYGGSFVRHPDYVPNGLGYGNNDLAVVRLQTPIVGVTPFELYDGELTNGMTLSMVGFGNPGTDALGQLAFDGYLRAGTNVLTGQGSDGSPQYFSYDSSFVFARFNGPFTGALPLEWMGSRGDSGGAWVTSDGMLAAISAFTTGPMLPGTFEGNSTGGLELADYHPWLGSTLTHMAVVPEPTSFVLGGFGGLVLGATILLRRKRKRN